MRFQRVYSTIVALFFLAISHAQLTNPVKWSVEQKSLGNNKVEIIATATIDAGWHLYGTQIPEGGPIATTFKLNTNQSFSEDGKVLEVTPSTKKHDTTFGMELSYFSNSAVLKKVITIKSTTDSIAGEIEYMACTDEACTPPEVFKFNLKIDNTATAETSEHSYFSIFILAFFAGFLALLTPCVFPMIPMTVSFFLKRSETKTQGVLNASKYGLSIVLIYVLLGTVVTTIFGADSLNSLATNPWFNLFFFLLLVVFAISFFGAFDIVLPSKWVNAADKNADKGGLIGIVFMALTLALVSFSCTGPLVGSLIVQAAQEGGWAPVIGMLGFSTAIALPFMFFAAFPSYLNSLPKSGGWLNSVKVVLGFLELAFAFKFLSIADMVLDLHILERELFIAIWVAIFGGLGFYLLGKLRLPHDSPMERLPVSRLILGLVTIAFTLYMIPGIWGAPVKLISGFPPPREYSEIPFSASLSTQNTTSNEQQLEGKHIGPQGIASFTDYDLALAEAKKTNKPLLLDFTGKGCVNCRKMEENVWSDPEIRRLIAEEYILTSLYVDLREDLPADKQYISPTTGKKIETVGNKWSDFQMSRFEKNSQPHYVILNHQEKEIIPSRAYDLSIPDYKNWLTEGLKLFNAQK